MILFYILLFGTGCVSASLLTDGRQQKTDHNYLASSLGNLNKNVERQLTNEENLVILSLSRTISVMTTDISDLKRQTRVIEEENDVLKKRLAEMNVLITKLQKEQAILNDDFSTDMNKLRANISDFDIKIRNMSVKVNKNNMEITNQILTADKGFGIVNRTIQNLKLNILQSQKKQADINVQSMEFQLNTSKLLTGLTTRVGFTVGMTATHGSIGTTTVIFPKVIYNSGDGYNSSTAIFTAPVTGDYVFYVAVVSGNKMILYLDISVKGSSKVRTMSWYSGGDSIYQTGTNMVVNHLQKGDKVWLKRQVGSRYYSQSVPITSFSGFLL